MKKKIALALILLLILLPACDQVRLPGFVPSATPRIEPVATRPLPPTPTATPPLPTPTPPVPLSTEGPWLTYLAASKIGSEVVAANQDGSARTVVGALSDVFVPVFARPSTSGAHWFGLLNGRDQSLTLFDLPEGKAKKVFALLSNPELSVDQRRAYATVLNQKTPPSQAWSPDGTMLAFIGAMDGAFSDLYVYNTTNDSLIRLTEKTGEAFYPAWSTDGQWIVVQEMQIKSTTGTALVTSVYALSPDGARFHTLYHPASLGEQVLGWAEPQTFIVISRRQMGLSEARRFMIEENRHALLQFSGLMEQVALDPTKTELAFIVTAKDKDVQTLPAGLYWTSISTGAVTVQKGKWQRLEWSPGANRFFASYPGGVLSFAPNQEKLTFEGEDNLPKASPNGDWLAFYANESGARPGLRLVSPDGKQVREVTNQPVTEVLWRPDVAGLLFVSNGDLYDQPLSGEARLLDQGVTNLGWVGAP